MKKLILILLLSFGFIGTASAHLEDVIICKTKVVTGHISGMEKNVTLELSVAAQNNTDSSKQFASVGIFSPSGELVSLHDVFTMSAVEPGSTATYIAGVKLYYLSTIGGEEADIQAEIDHHLQLYTEMYKDSTCKILGYR